MPRGVRSHPQKSVTTPNRMATTDFCRNVFHRRPWLFTKMPEVTTPARAIDAIAPLPNGQMYRGRWRGNGIHFAVDAIQRIVIAANHARGAQCHRRVAIYRIETAR